MEIPINKGFSIYFRNKKSLLIKLAGFTISCLFYLLLIAATPGNSSPSRLSSIAPPPVET